MADVIRQKFVTWADMTWNPVTGCLHGCEYCYARRIANRYKPKSPLGHDCSQPGGGLQVSDWLVYKALPNELHLVHRYNTNTRRVMPLRGVS